MGAPQEVETAVVGSKQTQIEANEDRSKEGRSKRVWNRKFWVTREEKAMAELKYRRILLKLGGEALAGEGGFGINPSRAEDLARKVIQVINMGVQIAIVIGGGNIWRGKEDGLDHGMERVTADHMGMLATVINSLALQDALERQGLPTRVMTGIEVRAVAEPYIQRRAVRHLEKGRVVIFGAGTGNPYFTTDTAASLRAIEIEADVILKGTRVDGIYTADPEKDTTAKKFDKITFAECISKNLRVMDMTAFTLCMENNLPIVVFDMNRPGNLRRVVTGEKVGTLVTG